METLIDIIGSLPIAVAMWSMLSLGVACWVVAVREWRKL
jgi:hypothetical protein